MNEKEPTPAAGGPLTLEEARALLAARAAPSAGRAAPAARQAAAKKAAAAAKKAAVPAKKAAPAARKGMPAAGGAAPGPEAVLAGAGIGVVAAERRRLALARRRELQQRARDYKALMQLMKKRGVKGLVPAGAQAAPAVPARKAPARRAGLAPKAMPQATPQAVPQAVPQAAGPLQILAEGDSWFDYPAFLKGGLVPRIERRLGLPILSLAKAGDEVRYMMGVADRKLLAQHLHDGSPAGGAWDLLLFSGGGNDIVDNPMALWVREFAAGRPAAELLNRPRFDAALAMVRAGYEDLIALRDRHSPGTHLLFHGYDFAIPDGRGICHMGPWLKPSFDLRGFPDRASAFGVVRVMLSAFAAMLETLTAASPRVSVVRGQGTLEPVPGSWHNELHPSKEGFDRHAELFLAEIRRLFPGRVPA